MWTKASYIARGRTLPQIWRIPLVVGSLLTLANQNEAILNGDLKGLAFPLVFNFVTPYVVSSLGYMKNRPYIAPASNDTEKRAEASIVDG